MIETDAQTLLEEEGELDRGAPKPSMSPLKASASLIQVGARGAEPANFAQQIDYAMYMAKARLSVPEHLHGNPGDCLAVVDIASRAGLSSYMVANMTYVQNKRLCFMSQLFHALLIQSNRLKGDLRVRYDGDGDEMTCTVFGTLRGETEPHSYTSPPLKDLHPGHTTKEGKTFVKGSPLWDRKPKVQMFYDASRDWTRMFCPVATLGILAPEEPVEYPIGPDRAIDVTPENLHARLAAGGEAARAEGHRDGHVESELSQIAPDRPGEVIDGEVIAPEPEKPKVAEKKKPSAAAKAAADRAEAAAAKRKPQASELGRPAAKVAEAERPAPSGPPKTAAEYAVYARAWIAKAKSLDDAMARWDGERDDRDALSVPIGERKKLEAEITQKFEAEA